MMKMQLAKQRPTLKESEVEMNKAAVKKEFEFQRKFTQQASKQEAQVEHRTKAECSTNSDAMQRYIGSLHNVETADKYKDKQAEPIIKHAIKDTQFVLVGGCQIYIYIYIYEILEDIGTAQGRRALASTKSTGA